jgi:hypothetical protein
MRQAISPRLAIRSLVIMGFGLAAFFRHCEPKAKQSIV